MKVSRAVAAAEQQAGPPSGCWHDPPCPKRRSSYAAGTLSHTHTRARPIPLPFSFPPPAPLTAASWNSARSHSAGHPTPLAHFQYTHARAPHFPPSPLPPTRPSHRRQLELGQVAQHVAALVAGLDLVGVQAVAARLRKLLLQRLCVGCGGVVVLVVVLVVGC